jgi:hypothetical protein
MTNAFEDIENWVPTQAGSKDLISACGNFRLYGGFGILGKGASLTRQFELPPHKSVEVSFKLFKIDSWDNEKFLMYFDGEPVFSESYQWSQGTDLCGNSLAKQWKE